MAGAAPVNRTASAKRTLPTADRLRPGTRHPFQESQLIRTVAPRAGDRLGCGLLVWWNRDRRAEVLPDQSFAPRHFKEPATLRIDDQDVAVGQRLFHAAEARVERVGVRGRIGPGNGLRPRVVLEDATALVPA